MIDIINGTIKFEDTKVEISWNFKKEDLIKSGLEFSEEIKDNIKIKEHPVIAGTKFYVNIWFKNKYIDGVFLHLYDPSASTSWDDFNPEEEKRKHDEWSLKTLGKPPYIYEWGSIEACEDKRYNNGTDIIIEWDRNRLEKMVDLVEYSLPDLLNENQSKSYREMVKNSGKSLMRFLKENSLITIEPFEENGELKEDLEVRQSQLTGEGLEIFKKSIPNWWNYLNIDEDTENVKKLEKVLIKIRSEKK